MNDLAQALMVAIRVHAGQVDKQGEPYLLHVLRVMEAVQSERAKVLAALHDVIEDGDLSWWDLEGLFAEGMYIANSVEVLTHGPGESYVEYIEGIADGHSSTWFAECREVKLADLRDNLGRMPEVPGVDATGTGSRPTRDEWASLRRRYEKAIATLESVSVSSPGKARTP